MQVEPSLPDKLGAELKPSLEVTAKSGSNDGDKAQMHWDTSSDGENKLFLKILPVGNKAGGILGSVGEDKVQDRMNGVRDQVKLERELKEESVYMDGGAALLDRDLTNHRKRPYLDLSETAPQTSSGMSQKRPWNEISSTSVDEESAGKRLKSGFSVMSGHSNSRGRNSGDDSFACRVIDPGPISCIERRNAKKLVMRKLFGRTWEVLKGTSFPWIHKEEKILYLGRTLCHGKSTYQIVTTNYMMRFQISSLL
jgi:hypothetical protein